MDKLIKIVKKIYIAVSEFFTRRRGVTAIGKYIVIEEINEKIKTESGILLTSKDSDKLRYKKGVVITPGTDVYTVKKGDTIYYDKRAGHSMSLNSEIVSIIKENDVVIVL